MKKVYIIKTETYKRSLNKLKNPKIILAVEKKVEKLIGNPNLAIFMSQQHFGICEIKVGSKYRVYCIKKENRIILFLLGPALNHKENYKKGKVYQKLFAQLKKLDDEYGEDFSKEFEKSLG